jgi:hypothetical protein
MPSFFPFYFDGFPKYKEENSINGRTNSKIYKNNVFFQKKCIDSPPVVKQAKRKLLFMRQPVCGGVMYLTQFLIKP